MNTKLKRLSVLAVSILLIALLAACTNGGSKGLVEGKTNVLTSFYPLYDFTVKIGGDHVNVINVVPAGVEPHDWAPKSQEISQINKADLFVYQGLGFEGWVHDFLESQKKDAKVMILEASQGIKLIEAEHGSEHEAEHDHEHSQYDPHAWLSPQNAKKMADNIKNALIVVDGAHKADYEANYSKLAARFDQLDASYRDALGKLAKKDIVVSHQAFAYLCRDYGLNQRAIMGLSPDAEPTAQDMKEINSFIKANNVKYIFFEELVSDKLAKTLAKDAKVETLVLNPLEGLTDEQMKAGQDYFTVMEGNLQNLVKALQ